MSANGTKMVAVADGGGIYTSADSGATWVSNDVPYESWIAVSSSADGSTLLAASFGGYPNYSSGIYVSTNSGAVWTQATNNLPSFAWWTSVACSADGRRMYAGENDGLSHIYRSTDSGLTWQKTSAPYGAWKSIASSSDGTKLAAVTSDMASSIFTSSDSGDNWTMVTNAPGAYWTSIVCSADGTKLVVSSPNIGIYASSDSGVTWSPSDAPTAMWFGLASSADGSTLVAGANSDGPVYTSTNSGLNWTSNSTPIGSYYSAAASADGKRLVVATIDTLTIYTSQTIPSPLLSITSSPDGLTISWTVPSMSFQLQQNTTLTTTNWSPVTEIPALNFTNLQYQITVPVTNGRSYFRLASP